jgi:hypothetical protein
MEPGPGLSSQWDGFLDQPKKVHKFFYLLLQLLLKEIAQAQKKELRSNTRELDKDLRSLTLQEQKLVKFLFLNALFDIFLSLDCRD